MAEKRSAAEGVGDVARSQVPMSHRLGFWTNACVLSGWVLVLTSFLVGGSVGKLFPLKMAVPIILFGTLSNALVGMLIAGASARTGYSSALLYRFAYGRKGVIFPIVIMGLTVVGWFSVILSITRDGLAQHLGLAAGSVPWLLITIALGALFVLPAVLNIRWIAYVDWVAVPAFLIVFGVVLVMTLKSAGGIGTLWNKWYSPEVSPFIGFDMAAGGWLVGVTIIADVARFWKSGRQAALGLLIAYGGIVTIEYWGGAIGAAYTGDYNLFNIVNVLGLGFIAWVALYLGAQSTIQGGVYGAGLAFSAPPIPLIKNQEYMRKLMTVCVGIAGIVGNFAGIDRVFFWWVQFLTWIVAPIAITIILDYWAFPARRLQYEDVEGADMTVNPAAFVAWIAGVGVGSYTGMTGAFSALITGMATAGVVYYVWMRAAIARGTTPEIQVFGKRLRTS